MSTVEHIDWLTSETLAIAHIDTVGDQKQYERTSDDLIAAVALIQVSCWTALRWPNQSINQFRDEYFDFATAALDCLIEYSLIKLKQNIPSLHKLQVVSYTQAYYDEWTTTSWNISPCSTPRGSACHRHAAHAIVARPWWLVAAVIIQRRAASVSGRRPQHEFTMTGFGIVNYFKAKRH